jgi:NTE family protein
MTTTLNAVFQGGGVKGIGLVGALARVEQEKVKFAGLAGTSAGSIVAALYAAGYGTEELKKILMETSFAKLLDPGWFGPWQLWKKYGIHRGQRLYEWVYELLHKKGIVHFKDVRDHDLKVIASDVRHKDLIVFDKEKHPSVEVAEAVRMSIGIPFFFEAYRFGQSLVVDGGLLSNYPLWVFAHSKEPTIGFKLVSKGSNPVPRSPTTFPQFLTSLVSTMLEARDKEDEKTIEWARTIHIPTHDIGTTDFSLDDQQKELLYSSGHIAADEFIKVHKGNLVNASSSQVADVFESLERFRRLTEHHTDKVFKPTEIKRRILVEKPNADLEVSEDLTNISEQSQNEVIRHITTDAPTEKKDLCIKAWVKLDDAETEAPVDVTASKNNRVFSIRIGFRGRVVGLAKTVQIRWKCMFPNSVPLDQDYWLFPVNLYTNRPENLTVEAVFNKIPADLQFFAVSDDRLSPMNLVGPAVSSVEGTPNYKYSTTIASPVDFHVLRWRME